MLWEPEADQNAPQGEAMAKADSTAGMAGMSGMSGLGGIAVGLVASVIAATIFVVLTSATGTTYHLFPVLIAFLPAGLPRVVAERPVSVRAGTIAAALGFVVVLAIWLSLELLDEMPSATLIGDQPGGVAGEFVLFGAIGALVGGWWGTRPA